jgi:Cof subfamily protein (haloacid dehalogenase superfamily)
MGIRLVALDLDGTLLGEPPVITSGVKAALQQVRERGIHLAIVTGRMHQTAIPYFHEVQATLPLVSYQGALIKQPANNTIYRHQPVPFAVAKDLLEAFQGYGLPVHVYLHDQLYIQAPVTEHSLRYLARTGVTPVVIPDLGAILTDSPTKLLAFWEKHDEVLWQNLCNRFDPAIVHLTRSTAEFVEAVHPMGNKGEAVRYLAEEILGCKQEEVFAIGDYFNDLEMLRYAGVGVAMGSAPDEVKAAANWVAPTVEEDGVRVALERFVL